MSNKPIRFRYIVIIYLSFVCHGLANDASSNKAQEFTSFSHLDKKRELSNHITEQEAKSKKIVSNASEIDYSNNNAINYKEGLVWLGGISLLVSVGFNIHSVLSKRRDNKKSIVDDYWFRSILMPIVLEPFKELILHESKNFEGLRRMSDDELFTLIKRIDGSRANFDILRFITPEVVNKIEEQLDKLQYTVASIARPSERNIKQMHYSVYGTEVNPFIQCFQMIIKNLIEAHKAIKY